MNEYPIFVIGACHHNTLGVIRSLGIIGINPYVIIVHKKNNPYIGYSRYIKKLWVVPRNEDALNILLENNHDTKPVVIACSDGLSSIIDDHSEVLSKKYSIPGNGGGVSYLMNKGYMAELADKMGFNVPESVTTTIETQILPFEFPWIIKPLASKNGKKSDVKKIYSSEEWDAYKSEGHAHDIQIQRLIEKRYEYQLIGVSLDAGNEVIIPGVSEIIRPAENTNTGFLHYVKLNEDYSKVVAIGKNFLKATKYSGLFSLEFIRGTDGEDYFMEINFRNDGNAICVTAAGINLPFVWYLYNTGQNYKNYLSQLHIKDVYVMPEIEDLGWVKHRRISVWRWFKDFLRTDCFMEFSRKDPSPFYHLIKNKIRNIHIT